MRNFATASETAGFIHDFLVIAGREFSLIGKENPAGQLMPIFAFVNPTATFIFDIKVTTRYVAPAYPSKQQEAAYVTSLSDRG
jgi:hypothetical protein